MQSVKGTRLETISRVEHSCGQRLLNNLFARRLDPIAPETKQDRELSAMMVGSG